MINTMIKKISFSGIVLVSLLFMTTSCEKWLDVNHNIDGPSYIPDYLYLAGIEQAYQGLYWDIRAIGPMTQMMGTTSYTTFAGHYYSAGVDNGGELWRMTYWLQGKNLENMIHQAEESGRWTLAGMGYIMKAFSWDQLTKYHGEVILEDAFVEKLLTHDYDYQSAVYTAVRGWAYKGIKCLQKVDTSIYGTEITANDYIYKGDKAKWIKFGYGVLVRNLASLSNKTNFNSLYAPDLVKYADSSFVSYSDDAALTVGGGGNAAAQSAYNNFWGTSRANLSRSYFQHEYAVQLLTGTVPTYDPATGNKTAMVPANTYYKYQLAVPQIICDTIITVVGHYDPRVAVKLSTKDDATYLYMDNARSIQKRKYYGGSSTSTAGPISNAPSFYGREATSSTVTDGKGKWIYRDDAPYILMTCAEIKLCQAEAYYKLGMMTEAYNAFKAGVKADLDFTGNYIFPGNAGRSEGGDKISKTVFTTLANQYKAGPYVDGLTQANLTLSHIMMQKWIALYPWGALEAWVDMRKYHYDIAYTGDFPSSGNGWTLTYVTTKWDNNPAKVYKGLYLYPSQVTSRMVAYNVDNQGSPCYRIRPRYNSEYMWNKPSLDALKPISGLAPNYQCSIPWFAYPGDMPTTK
jgi:hypothetical protein